MELTLTTPALLFPAISLLFLSYTNKFLALASLIRALYREYREDPSNATITKQLANLRKRMQLIKYMQATGIVSFILCVVDMFLFYLNYQCYGIAVFATSLVFLLLSLMICLLEIHISTDALSFQIEVMEGP